MAYRQLTTEERYQIGVLRQQGLTNAAIGVALGRHRSTIRREVKRNATPHDGAYRPKMAVEMTNGRRRRSRRNARYGAEDFATIEALVREQWSPDQIVGQRRREGLAVMSHETIYLHSGRIRKTVARCGATCAGRASSGANATAARTAAVASPESA